MNARSHPMVEVDSSLVCVCVGGVGKEKPPFQVFFLPNPSQHTRYFVSRLSFFLSVIACVKSVSFFVPLLFPLLPPTFSDGGQ